ncbi:unnamed protein product [Brassica oleracea var. botrytis]|uniref:BnaC08g19830D protein n=3 Tax=Brassica TaxID=3705 RepID=A0A078HN58_BRANA|nr:hypothetical protein HID58_081498 [Brassica napus]CAF2109862.1 unnamed protein product [Brassica napus]CDY38809.1 BnaC08g19830D [Brassica napus]VDD56498.1 unnamed protein product [Brassica oleracea]
MIERKATPVICCSNHSGTVNLYIYNDGNFIRRGSLYSLATVDILLFGAQNLLFTGGKNDTFRAWRRNVFG